MHVLKYPMALLGLVGLLAGCAMNQKECQNADWHAYGYTDGSRGRPVGRLYSYDKQCSKFGITPDANAYNTGWNAGVRTFCTSANGFNTGAAGYPASNVCPPDVASTYLGGYRQGLAQYCSPANALQMGLSGSFYTGACPPDMSGAFMQRYQLGEDVRGARDRHRDIEGRLDRVREALGRPQSEKSYHELLENLHHLRHADERSEARLAALNACVSDDWFQAGLSDGENGQPARDQALAGLCGSFGSGADPGGYRDGWMRGNAQYCSYPSGLYAGQAGLDYEGVCQGPGYAMFWSGYMVGMTAFRAGRYAGHARPQYRHEVRRAPRPAPRARPAQRPRMQASPALHSAVHRRYSRRTRRPQRRARSED